MGPALPTASRELPRLRPAVRFEYLIGMRYLRARRRERFVSLIAIISLAGVTLGTFALTVVLSVMSGFQEDLRERLLAFTPHVTVQTLQRRGFDPAPLLAANRGDPRRRSGRALRLLAGDGGFHQRRRTYRLTCREECCAA